MASDPKKSTATIEDETLYEVKVSRPVKYGVRPILPHQKVVLKGAALKVLRADKENEGAIELVSRSE